MSILSLFLWAYSERRTELNIDHDILYTLLIQNSTNGRFLQMSKKKYYHFENYYEDRKYKDFGDKVIKALYFSEITWVYHTF